MTAFNKTFSVDSALLKELGERLVTTPHVALAELVKNAYDADATEVSVKIGQGSDGGPKIEVKDNGNGMTLDQIEKFWMKIGNTHKRDEKRSPRFGRPLSGSKGIGRFCVRRLGTQVIVQSTADRGKGGVEENRLEIDWGRFTPGTDVGAVEVSGESSLGAATPTGLTLTMSGHPSVEWRYLEDKRSYHYLKRQLATLVANQGTKRGNHETDPGFNVTLDAPSLIFGHDIAAILDDGDGHNAIDFRESLMTAGWAELIASIDESGRIHCELKANTPVGAQSHESTFRLKHLRHVTLRLAIFVEDSNWNRNEQLVPLGKLNKILQDWGGVHVRQNGLRVFPYGDVGDDWLEIDRDRGRSLGKPPEELAEFVETIRSRSSTDFNPNKVLLSMLSAKAFMGGVDISPDQEGLEQRADRQGFVEGKHFDELRLFTRYAINWAMIWRDFAVKERERLKVKRFTKELEASQKGKPIPVSERGYSALKVIRSGIQQLEKDPGNITKEAVEYMASAAGLIEADLKTTHSDIVRYQLVASAATLSLLYHHEVQFLGSALASLEAELSAAVPVLRGKQKKRSQEVLRALEASKENLDALSDLTQDMGILDRKAQAVTLDLALNVDRAIAQFHRVCDAYGIKISKDVGEGLLVGPMLKGELAAVLLNVLSNAIKAVVAGGEVKSLIKFHGYRSGRKVCLEVKDNGIGVERTVYESAFTPLVSDPSAKLYDALEERLDQNERQLLGQGSGLGLSIVRGVLERHDGSVLFKEPVGSWSTIIHLEFKSP